METLLKIIEAIGIDNTLALLALATIGMGMRAIYLIVKRGDKDAAVISQALAREQARVDQEIAEDTETRHLYTERIATLEKQLTDCQRELLKRKDDWSAE